MRQKFLSSFPNELLNQAVSFENIGEVVIAWTSESIESVIDWITKKNAVILGGRVFLEAEEVFFFTGLEWNMERNELDWNAFVQKSAEMSLSVIQKNRLNHKNYLYVLNFAEEEEIIIRQRLPKHFPEALINFAFLLDTIGYAEIAWKYEYAIRAVYLYVDNHYGILGGDVYKCNKDNIFPTVDSWHYDFKNCKSIEYIDNSRDKAISYINDYHKQNGDTYCYTLTVQYFKE